MWPGQEEYIKNNVTFAFMNLKKNDTLLRLLSKKEEVIKTDQRLMTPTFIINKAVSAYSMCY
jgi:hypothetical protein